MKGEGSEAGHDQGLVRTMRGDQQLPSVQISLALRQSGSRCKFWSGFTSAAGASFP